MIPGNKVEIVGKYQSQDTDGFEKAWQATEVGVNYFWNKHKAKMQLTYRVGKNVFGVDGDDTNSIFMQWQFVF